MNNLFSIFDPTGQFDLSLNWVSLLMASLLLPSAFWLMKNQYSMVSVYFIKNINSEFKAVFPLSLRPGTTFSMVVLFSFISSLNLMSMMPYIFTPTGHLSISASLALPLWIGYLTMSTLKSPNQFFAHLVPSGTPWYLMSFMVIIECISLIIRPITLSVRLAANLVAGHLLLSLLGNLGSSMIHSFPVSALVVTGVILLLFLELGVALIQAYVFGLLSSLYISEVNPNSIK